MEKQASRNKFTNFLLFVGVIVLLSTISVASMRYYYFEQSSGISSYAMLLFLIIAFISVLFGKVSLKNNPILVAATIFSVVTLLSLFGEIVKESMINKVHIIISALSIPTGLIVGEILGPNSDSLDSNGDFSDGRYALFVIPVVLSIVVFSSMDIKAPDSVFIILLLFPLVFFFRNRVFDLTLFVFVGLSCLQSYKRSVIIVYGLMVILYLFSLRARSRRNISRSLTSFFLDLAFGLAVVYVIKDNSAATDHAIERFTEDETGGSGRQGMYEQVWAMFQSSSIGDKVLGHGFDAVKDQVFGIPAHNDLLEVLYDYGLLAAIAYCLLVIRIITLFIKLLKTRANVQFERLMIGVVLSFILVLSMLNCIITSPFFVFLIFFELGLTLSIIKKREVVAYR